jgi:hypothetical protein
MPGCFDDNREHSSRTRHTEPTPEEVGQPPVWVYYFPWLNVKALHIPVLLPSAYWGGQLERPQPLSSLFLEEG